MAQGVDMEVATSIRDTLTRAFDPRRIEVIDESARHAGHAGARPEGESHFRVTVVADFFEGMSRVERHRAVNSALSSLMGNKIHALALKVLTPGEERDT